MKKLNLRLLIISGVTFTFCMTIVINMWSANRLNNEILITNTLENNRVFAEKLASTTERYIERTFTTLQFSARYLANHLDDEDLLAVEAERLRTQNDMFNSVVILNSEGQVLNISPTKIEMKGQVLSSEGTVEALTKKEPLISKPYVSTTNQFIIFFSHPIFDRTGQYLGLVGGTINIEEENIFHSLLEQHFYEDGSQVYVIDFDGRVIYHQDEKHINEMMLENELIEKMMNGESGAMRVENSQGIEMLAGYSPIVLTNWGVVSQRPLKATLAPIDELNRKLIVNALPLFILVLIFGIWFANKIAQPINKLATITGKSSKENKVKELEQVSTWYYETRTLKAMLLSTLSSLHNEVNFFRLQSETDSLTGLMNRRSMDEQLEKYTENNIAFAVLIIDIDNFKSINDTFGHSVGDDVLKYLADMLRKCSEPDMTCYRFGGEEFVVLLPNRSLQDALQFAEKLRIDLETCKNPLGQTVTMSGGIALYPHQASTTKELLEKADAALYVAKQKGRNRIEISP